MLEPSMEERFHCILSVRGRSYIITAARWEGDKVTVWYEEARSDGTLSPRVRLSAEQPGSQSAHTWQEVTVEAVRRVLLSASSSSASDCSEN